MCGEDGPVGSAPPRNACKERTIRHNLQTHWKRKLLVPWVISLWEARRGPFKVPSPLPSPAWDRLGHPGPDIWRSLTWELKIATPGYFGALFLTHTHAGSMSPCWSYPVPWQVHLAHTLLFDLSGSLACTQLWEISQSKILDGGKSLLFQGPYFENSEAGWNLRGVSPQLALRLGWGRGLLGCAGSWPMGVVKGVAHGGAGVRRWLQLSASFPLKRVSLDPGEPWCSPVPWIVPVSPTRPALCTPLPNARPGLYTLSIFSYCSA